MAMVTNRKISFVSNLKPFKISWKIEVKVIQKWTQLSNCSEGDTLEFILEDKMGTSIHCICKSLFVDRVKDLHVGEWRVVENFSLIPAIGFYRRTSHPFKISIIDSTIVTEPSSTSCEMIDHNKDYEKGVGSSSSSSKRKEGDTDLNDTNSPAKKLCCRF
ncbi:unnamed protein product [Eruca vesicaria subsp. sativa]|uniref:Replication protein A 70 kDa DNA-binding subunit B/D first OB fold domain-containing protein n=1 Tax=Eruca vesicaria subsp. sativa TaxID=29727 RepID=A0ABC8JB52_ERUVS|nr:unnamed protein product [Eruca vesicaria subsp. sativa]